MALSLPARVRYECGLGRRFEKGAEHFHNITFTCKPKVEISYVQKQETKRLLV